MTRRTVEVRRAVPLDAGILLDLAAGVRADTAVDGAPAHPQAGASLEHLQTAMERPDVEVHVALADGEPVGVVVLRLGSLLVLAGGSAVHVEQLYVVPAWRRRGVARQLLAAAATTCERAGADDVACVVPPAGRDVQRFFARLGFAPLVAVRVVPVARLRAKLAAGQHDGRRRAALDQLMARRRRQLDRPETPPQGFPAVRGPQAAAAPFATTVPGVAPTTVAAVSAGRRPAAGR